MEAITELIVKEQDIDELGHVNNIVYVAYLQDGRTHWFTEAGISYQDMSARSLGTVVLRLDILYRKEARLGEKLRVVTRPVKLGNTSFVFEQHILNESGELITEAKVTEVMFDLTERRSTPVVEEIARHF
jgi:YbgC/YbaW family acyl-CoA thioester hydrolase